MNNKETLTNIQTWLINKHFLNKNQNLEKLTSTIDEKIEKMTQSYGGEEYTNDALLILGPIKSQYKLAPNIDLQKPKTKNLTYSLLIRQQRYLELAKLSCFNETFERVTFQIDPDYRFELNSENNQKKSLIIEPKIQEIYCFRPELKLFWNENSVKYFTLPK